MKMLTYTQIKPSFNQKLYQAFKFLYVLTGKSRVMDGFFRVEKFSKTLHPLHFSQKDSTLEDRKAFFKNQLLGIEFETHAYCNRTCSFCPNSFLDRRNKTQIMSNEIFNKIVDELQAIDFDGEIKMQRYNEPLANDIIYERVAITRKKAPKANISFHSNGDYVTMDKLKRLEAAGLNQVFVSLYPDYEARKNDLQAAGHELCHKFLEKVGVKGEEVVSKTSLGRFKFDVGNLEVVVFAFDLYGASDRGGSLKEFNTDTRTSPCVSPFARLYVDWTGDVFPCCNLRADFADHKNYIMGNLKDRSLMDIYYSKTANFMRRHLAVVGEKTGACKSCKFDIMCSNASAKKVLDQAMNRIGALAS